MAENPTSVYAILGAVALVVLVATWMNRGREITLRPGKDRRKEPRTVSALAIGGIILLVLALLAGGVWLIDRLVVTDEEQIVIAVREMAEGVRSGNVNRIFQHVSDTFQSPGGADKKTLRAYAEKMIKNRQITDLQVWDFRFKEGASRPQRSAKVLFTFRVASNGQMGSDFSYGCEATFRLDPDDRWRLQGFKVTTPPPTSEELRVPI